MKILQINKYNFAKGGADRIFLDTKQILKEAGHEVITFAMHHPKNQPSKYDKYFVSYVQTENPNLWQGIKSFARAVYSFEAANKLDKLIKDTNPDIAHLHNIYHQLSPSILRVLKKHKIPVVLTAHDYKIICPTYHLNLNGIEHHKNIFAHAWQAVVEKHYTGSFIAGLALSLEWLIHKIWRIYEKNIDMIIAPSEYVQKKFIEYGWPGEKIIIVPHFTTLEKTTEKISEYVLYAGRLSYEKGIDIFIKAAKLLPDVKFAVAGEGNAVFTDTPNITYINKVKPEDMGKVYSKASLLFMPTRANETFGLTVLEAAKFNVPALVSDAGALPEFVKNNETGFIFNPYEKNSAETAANIISKNLKDPETLAELGNQARINAQKYTSAVYLANLRQLYAEIR